MLVPSLQTVKTIVPNQPKTKSGPSLINEITADYVNYGGLHSNCPCLLRKKGVGVWYEQSIGNRSVNLTIYIAEQSSSDSAFCRGQYFEVTQQASLKIHLREHQTAEQVPLNMTIILLAHNITILNFKFAPVLIKSQSGASTYPG